MNGDGCGCRQGEDAAPTRVMVFAPTSEAAQACAPPIRNVLWGAHKVAVLLPAGEEPIKVPLLLFLALHLMHGIEKTCLLCCDSIASPLFVIHELQTLEGMKGSAGLLLEIRRAQSPTLSLTGASTEIGGVRDGEGDSGDGVIT